MDRDTAIGGPAAGYAATACSVLRGLRAPDEETRRRSFQALVAAYWKPVYKHVRLRWRQTNEQAKDLTQAFFALALEKGYFADYDATRARFRTFLRACLEGFLSKDHQAARRLKRGGDAQLVGLDYAGAEAELQAQGAEVPSAEELFDREWLRALFQRAVATLETELGAAGKEVHFRLFAAYDLAAGPGERRSYRELAEEHGLAVTDVTNYLALARRELRRLVLAELARITGSDDELAAEARFVFGGEGGR